MTNRLPLVSSRAGQAIEGTRSAREGQSQQSRSRQFPAAGYIPRGGRSQAGTPAEYRRRRHYHLRTDLVSHASAAGSIRSQHTYDLIASKPVSLMQAQRQGDLKYPKSTLLKSSNDLGWSTLFAELRSHGRCEGPGTAAPPGCGSWDCGSWLRRSTRDVQNRRKLEVCAADNGLDLVEADRSASPTRPVSARRSWSSYTYTCPPSPLRV